MSKNYKDVFNFFMLENAILTEHGLPVIRGTDYIPTNLIPFNYAMTSKYFRHGIHFYIDDYQFERVWNKPKTYTELLKKFDCVIAPDFSLYKNFPKPLQIYNLYRQRILTAYWQKQGITVIPNLTWSDIDSLNYALEGMPKHSVIALSTNGCLKNKQVKQEFLECFNKAIQYLMPIKILIIGRVPEELNSYKNIIKFNSYSNHFEKLHKGDIINGR